MLYQRATSWRAEYPSRILPSPALSGGSPSAILTEAVYAITCFRPSVRAVVTALPSAHSSETMKDVSKALFRSVCL